MRRRDFLEVLGGAVAAWPVAARAQQRAVPVVGFLRSASAASSAHLAAAFQQGLKDRGFVDGRNVTIDYRWGDGQLDRLPGLAIDLIHRRPAAIVGNALATRAIMAATTEIPIVFVVSSDPIAMGFVASINRPSGNRTGVVWTSSGLEAKRLGLLNELVPKSAAIAALFDPASPENELHINNAEKAARSIGRQLLIVRATDERELHAAFAMVAQPGIGGLLIGASAFFLSQRQQLAALAARNALPAISITRSFAEAGLLMSYGASQSHAYRRAGEYVSRILEGAKPADMPVEFASKLELIINLKTAKTLGLKIPPNLIALADEVID